MKTAIGICNFNGGRRLEAAVRGAFGQGNSLVRVLVVDNGSTDGSLDSLSGIDDPRWETLRLPDNHGGAGGFGAVSRHLVAALEADAIVLVDSDCILGEGCLGRLAAELDRGAGIVGPKVVYAERPGVIQEVGGTVDWDRAALVPRFRGHDEEAEGTVTGTASVDFVASCALLARREVFETIGHFRSEYFLYYDDVEWCLRARRAGFEVRATADARALHYGGSLRKRSHLPTYYAWRNRVHCFQTHAPDPEQVRRALVREVAQAVATCRMLGLPRSAEVIHRASREGFRGVSGRCRWSPEDLALDDPGSEAASAGAGAGEPDSLVDHLFESALPLGSPETVVRDRFGKRAAIGWIESLRPAYQELRTQVLETLGAEVLKA